MEWVMKGHMAKSWLRVCALLQRMRNEERLGCPGTLLCGELENPLYPGLVEI